jgi:hypothetical protein
MANAINDIIKQSVNNITNIQQANQQLQSILGQSQNKQTTGSQQLPSNLVLSPFEASQYNTLMTEDPTTSEHVHGKVVATYLSPAVPQQIQEMMEPSHITRERLVTEGPGFNLQKKQYSVPTYPELTNMLTDLSKQGQSALQGYISNQQNIASSLFANTWEAPNKDTSSISLSLAGNQPKNQIMQQYESKYNEMQQQLDTQKQNYLSQLETMRTNIQNSLQQLANPDTAKALIIGTTATYLQNIYNRISPWIDSNSYNKLTQQLRDIYLKDQQFANSYNQLFQNYLGMNTNLIDMLKQVQANVFSGIQQGSQNSLQQYQDLLYNDYVKSLGKGQQPISKDEYIKQISKPVFGMRPPTVPNVTDMSSAIKAQRTQNWADEEMQETQFADTHFGISPMDWNAYIQSEGQPPTSKQDVDQWKQSGYSVGG